MLNIHTYKHTGFIYLESYTINSISTIPKGKSRVRWGRGWGRVEVGLFFEALRFVVIRDVLTQLTSETRT